MKVLIITCSPNKDGLTEACGSAAQQGVLDGKGEPVVVRLNRLKLSRCMACKNGYGSCGEEGVCQIKDDFQALQEQVAEADGLIVVTPVYWWDMSEPAKAFFDRLRRCEAMKETNHVKGKPFICIAAAGGSGYGTTNCLASMEKVFLHLNNLQYPDLRDALYDLIGVTQKNRSYTIEAIRAAAKNMVVSSS